MNSDQLQTFLEDLSTFSFKGGEEAETSTARKLLNKTSQSTHLCMNYITCNYTDIDLVQPIVAQLLALYYKEGVLRQYTLQFIPCFVGCYLLALSKKQHKSISMFETFFLAVYNEEILEERPSSSSMIKKVEEVRIPSIRFPSIYHDPTKMNALPDIATIKPGGTPSVLSTVRIGPYPTLEHFTAENKFIILTRLLKSVNNAVCYLSSEVLSRYICLATLSISLSGFSFPVTPFRARVMGSKISEEVLEDYSRKSRQHVNSALLLELLTGVYLALFNGAPDLALRSIDALHQRSHYEMLPDVIMVTNAIRNSLLENPLSKEKMDELMWSRSFHKEVRRKDLVTNASLRMKKMPEDIPIQPDLKEKEHSKLSDLVEEGKDHLNDLKKRVAAISLHSKAQKRRKSIDGNDMELKTINEELVPPEKVADKPINISNLEPVAEIATTTVSEVSEAVGAAGDGASSDLHVEEEEELSEKGAFSVGGLRHMDSGGSTHRSIDLA